MKHEEQRKEIEQLVRDMREKRASWEEIRAAVEERERMNGTLNRPLVET